MMSLRLAAALAAVGLFTSGVVFAEGAKPNDAQIAHIAYTAGQLDIEAAELAKKKRKARTRTSSPLPPTWSEITKP
jgi:putative membrane protein